MSDIYITTECRLERSEINCVISQCWSVINTKTKFRIRQTEVYPLSEFLELCASMAANTWDHFALRPQKRGGLLGTGTVEGGGTKE